MGLDLKRIVNSTNRKLIKKTLTDLAAQQLAQLSLDLYMSMDEDIGDMYYRLGTTISYTSDGKPIRINSFKDINDKINDLQKALRILTGEIRTKITEWDLSTYIHRLQLTATSPLTFTLLYRLKNDNPSKYKDSRALVYGIVNAAVTQSRYLRWNPTADPDLRYWVPPNEMKKTWNFFGATFTLPTTASPSKVGWSSWIPLYWELFFTDPGLMGVSEADQKAYAKKLAQREEEGLSTINLDQTDIGLNLDSPIFYGGPIGGNRDPRSLSGYLSNSAGSFLIPKIAPTAVRTNSINMSFPYTNPWEGISSLLNGWKSPNWSSPSGGMWKDVSLYIAAPDRYHVTTLNEQSLPTELKNFIYANKSAQLLFISADRTMAMIATVDSYINPPGGYGPNGPGTYYGRPFTIDLTKVIGFYADKVSYNPSSIITYFNTTRWFKGVYARIPKRTTLTANSNVLTDGWTSITGLADTDLDRNAIGALLAKMWTIYTWDKTDPILFKEAEKIAMDEALKHALSSCSSQYQPYVYEYYRYYMSQWKPIEREFTKATLENVITSLSSTISPLLESIEILTKIFKTTTPEVLQSLIDALGSSAAKPEVVQSIKLFQSKQRTFMIQFLTSISSSATELYSILRKFVTKTNDRYHLNNMTALYTSYPRLIDLLEKDKDPLKMFFSIFSGQPASLLIVNAIRSYLALLYEQRLILLKKRLNKTNGTLLTIARNELAISAMMSIDNGLENNLQFFEELLTVRRTVTNLSIVDKAKAKNTKSSLPPEVIVKVYVPVQKTDKGEIIRHKAGYYEMYSQEVCDSDTLEPIKFYITFTGTKAPRIIKNVITSLNFLKLQQIATNKNLSILEKVCYARDLEDWWEIIIPTTIRPPVANYKSNILLILPKSEAFFTSYTLATGNIDGSDVPDPLKGSQIGITKLMRKDKT